MKFRGSKSPGWILTIRNAFFRSIAFAVLVCLGLATSAPRVSAQPGLLDPTFITAITNPVVNDVFVRTDGRILVHYGWPDYGLVGLTKDGVLDSSLNFGLPVGSKVNGVGLEPDGKIVVSGNFLEVLGVPRPCLARFNADGSLDTGFVPQIMAANIPAQPTNAPPLPYTPVNSMGVLVVQPDGKILITGIYYMVATNGDKLPPVVRFNTDGSLDNSFTARTNVPYRMAVQSDGKILMEEAVNRIGYGSNIVYRLNQDGVRDSSFAQVNIYGWANVLLPQSNSVILAGYMIYINSLNGGEIARVDLNGHLDTGFHQDSAYDGNGITTAISQTGGKLLIAGTFTASGSGVTNKNLARLNIDGSLDTSYASSGANSYVWALALQPDGKALVGGEFTKVNNTPVPALVRLTGDSDAGPGTVVFDSPKVTTFENSAQIVVKVDRVWGKQGEITVNYTTESGSAIGGLDYQD